MSCKIQHMEITYAVDLIYIWGRGLVYIDSIATTGQHSPNMLTEVDSERREVVQCYVDV